MRKSLVTAALLSGVSILSNPLLGQDNPPRQPPRNPLVDPITFPGIRPDPERQEWFYYCSASCSVAGFPFLLPVNFLIDAGSRPIDVIMWAQSVCSQNFQFSSLVLPIVCKVNPEGHLVTIQPQAVDLVADALQRIAPPPAPAPQP